jgi:hypothetical protein
MIVQQQNLLLIYRRDLARFLQGEYFIEPVMMDTNEKWGGVRPFSRIWITVTN